MSTKPEKSVDEILTHLQTMLSERKNAPSESSYVATLYHKGLDQILKKIGEEATETVLAAKNLEHSRGSQDALTHEAADLFFHTFVALSYLGIPIETIFRTLGERIGISGLEEKASRHQ